MNGFDIDRAIAVCYVASMTMDMSTVDIDLRGMLCPMTFVKLRMALDRLPEGAECSALYDASPSNETVPKSVEALGHRVMSKNNIDTPGQAPLVLLRIKTGSS